MRISKKNGKISVQAIAGTEVVLLGLNAEEKATKGLLGFSVFKKQKPNKIFKPLRTGRVFEKNTSATANATSENNPFQTFMWSDYSVKPGTSYTYKVVPVYGKPDALKPGEAIEVNVTTENPEDKIHAVFFNRGVAGSQAYSSKFGEYRKWYQVENFRGTYWQDFIKPKDVPNRKAYKWLSSGLEEAILKFIGQAKNADYSLRAAVYEFSYTPIIQAFVNAIERKVDVKIIYHAKHGKISRLKRNPKTDVSVSYKDNSKEPFLYKSKYIFDEYSGDSVCLDTINAVKKIGLRDDKYKDAFESIMIERKNTQISHNKFIILLKNDKPIQVWTGSTNFTEGGIFGQSNVGHIIRDEDVAQKYFEYWGKLSSDPKRKSKSTDPPGTGIANWTEHQQADFVGPPPPSSFTPVFSPRLTRALLNWYAERLAAAKNSVFFTAAFSLDDEIFKKLKVTKASDGKPYLRYLLLEGITGLFKAKYPVLAQCLQNRIAWGEILKKDKNDNSPEQLIETLTGLNNHVNYLHTKYLLIDPLSDDPIIITGSANFSEASTTKNDENMIIIRGNKRVADIYITEFMRLFNHFHSRNVKNRLSNIEVDEKNHLYPDDSWTKPYYEKGTQKHDERLLFS